MPAATTVYHRSPQDARRVAESFRASTKAIDGKRLGERIAALASSDLPEDTGGKHTSGYIAAIMEVAADAKPEDRSDARKFAQAFVSKDAAYSRTRAGLAAVQLEAWIIEHGGTLYSQFVETVLDSGESKFLAIFQGRLTESDKDRLRSGTSAFVSIEPIAEAGLVNYEMGDLLEFSMFDCTAQGKLDKNAQPKDATQYDQLGRTDTPTFAHESVLPKSRDEYDRVYESGGITQAAALYLFGSRVQAATMGDGQLSFLDDNGTRWVSESGEKWVPDVDSIVERDEPEDEPEDEPDDEESDDEPEACESVLYEANERTGALRSRERTWAVFAGNVLVEGIETARTIVVVGGKAYGVSYKLADVRAKLDEQADDAEAVAALQAAVRVAGSVCENSAEVVRTVLPEADDEEEPDDEEPEDEEPPKKEPVAKKKPKEGDPANPR